MLQGIRQVFKFNVLIVSIYLIKRGENMFKKIITAVLATLMLCWCIPMNVYAQETTANAEQALRGPVCPFDRYTVVVSKNYTTNWGPTYQAKNTTSTMQSMSISTTRTVSSSFNTTVAFEINDIIASVGVSAEVGINTSYSENVVININAPAYSTVYAHSGSKTVYGTAELRQLNTDCSVDVIKRYSYSYTYDVATEWWQ